MNNFRSSLHRFAQLAQNCPALLAGPLTLYQDQERLTDRQLAARLGCTVEALHRLALCERPRSDPNFREDVARIAEYIQAANTLQLAMVIRAAESREALHQQTAQNVTPHVLLAARDNEEELPNE
jgi:hypothetical protein